MNQSGQSSASGFSGLDELRRRAVSCQSGKRKGPPMCYKPKQPAVDPLPNDGTMKFTVIRQIKEAVENQNCMRRDNRLCDVVLVSGNKRFPCHKVILASASPYFNGMFTRGMLECCRKEVNIREIEPDILSIIIDFIYTAEIQITEDCVCQLMTAATMLQMPHIIEACTTFLEYQLDPSNCIGIGKFAQTFGCLDLQKKAEHYILKYFGDVSMEDEFKDISIEELTCIISSNRLTVKCETEVYKAVLRWVSGDIEKRKNFLTCLLEKVRLCNIPPKFIKEQLDYCEVLKQAPKPCLEKLSKLFHEMQLHATTQFQAEPPRPPCEKQVIYCIGGYLRSSVNNVEFFNPQNNEWRRVADVPHPRSGLAACTILGYIYAIGGRNSRERNEDLSIVDCYNPKTNEWSPQPPMLCRRSRVTTAVLDNKMYAIGGTNVTEALQTVECFDPLTKDWTMIANMNDKRIAAGAAVVNRFLYVVGGLNGSIRLHTMEKYHPEENRWICCPPMSTARSGAGVAAIGQHIYVAGGYDSTNQISSVERFDTTTERWEFVADMRNARSALTMVAMDRKLYVFGGYGGSGFVTAVECYDPATNTWSEIATMISSRSGQGVTVGPLPTSIS